jgi:hypothetical protein
MKKPDGRKTEAHPKNDLQSINLRNQIRFLLFLYYLKFKEKVMRLRRVSPRARIHWVGRARRPRRLERALFATVFFLSMLAFERFEYLLWAVVWGSAASFFVIVRSVGLLVESRRSWS